MMMRWVSTWRKVYGPLIVGEELVGWGWVWRDMVVGVAHCSPFKRLSRYANNCGEGKSSMKLVLSCLLVLDVWALESTKALAKYPLRVVFGWLPHLYTLYICNPYDVVWGLATSF